MDEEHNSNWIGGIVGFVIIAVIIWWFSGVSNYEGQSAQDWFNAYDNEVVKVEELESRVNDLETALQEANDNIEDANSQIREAQYSAWESYSEMGDALDTLQEVDTVSEP